MGVGGRDIPPARALEHVWGYGAGLDMTRRDRQKSLQAGGNPWEEGKVFDCAAPVSPLQPVHRVGHPARGRIWLEVDGDTRQSADIASMTWSLPEIIAHLSALFTLAPGDLIFTGTPAGVGPVSRGQRLHGGVEGIAEIAVRIV